MVLDLTSALMYALHFVSPLILGWFFWHTLNERRTFYVCVYAFTVLNVMALITFMVYPAAPPWYVYSTASASRRMPCSTLPARW